MENDMTPKEATTIEAHQQAKSKWHWTGSKGSYLLERFVFVPAHPSWGQPSNHLVAGEIYRTQRAVGNGMYQKAWGVRKAKDPAHYIGWDYSTFETIAHLDWMPYKEAQQTAMVLLLAGLDV
jgi:hypothetical protein